MHNLPEITKLNLKKLISEEKLSHLRANYQQLSDDYKAHRFRREISYGDAVAYACARMPATYNTIMYVLGEFHKKMPNFHADSVLDIGSGTGALMSAFISYNISPDYTAIEKSVNMKKVSEKLVENSPLKVKFQNKDILEFFKSNRANYDCTFLVYSFNEFKDKEKILDEIDKITTKCIFLIEPGTPEGFNNIKLIKELARNKSCAVIAPCAADICPLSPKDWCHFSVRLPRNANHTFIKNAKLSYEDEKFCYIIISKDSSENLSENRIIKRPIKRVGHMIFDTCTSEGIKRFTISNKVIDKKPSWGDELKTSK
ncbi:ribosomal small subunit Rsm22 [Alphaproteobacteria bacterium]|nr:ribosomal small subunit Rsm22 [Alphaproteobacteria bacterium]